MEPKFTKGPWRVLPPEEDKEYLRVRGTMIGGRYKIANVHDLKSHHDGSKWCEVERVESVANAKLIEISPDMYKTLKAIHLLIVEGQSEWELGNELRRDYANTIAELLKKVEVNSVFKLIGKE